jgi:hypothetical protein
MPSATRRRRAASASLRPNPGPRGASPRPFSRPAEPTPRRILSSAIALRKITGEVTSDEFFAQDARYSRDSRYGRELLFLMAYNGWIRTTTGNVNLTRSDSVDTAITMELDFNRITHEAFHARGTDAPPGAPAPPRIPCRRLAR